MKAERWKELCESIVSQINELMRYTEMHYSMNPAQDKMLSALEKIKNDLFKEE